MFQCDGAGQEPQHWPGNKEKQNEQPPQLPSGVFARHMGFISLSWSTVDSNCRFMFALQPFGRTKMENKPATGGWPTRLPARNASPSGWAEFALLNEMLAWHPDQHNGVTIISKPAD